MTKDKFFYLIFILFFPLFCSLANFVEEALNNQTILSVYLCLYFNLKSDRDRNEE